MSHFKRESEQVPHGDAVRQCNAFLRVIDAGGKNLSVLLLNGWRITGDPTFKWFFLDGVDVVALWFSGVETEDVINRNIAAAGIKVLGDDKLLAVIGVRRDKICHAAQAACTWVIY